MEDRIAERVVAKLSGSKSQTYSSVDKDPRELLIHYYEKQKAAKKADSCFFAKKRKQKSDQEGSTEDIYVDTCTMHRTRRGGWISCGDNVKVLATYGDNYDTIISRMIKALNCDLDEPLLICGGSIIMKESFVTLGHFFQAAHVKPGKVLFGVATLHEEVSSDVQQSSYSTYRVVDSVSPQTGQNTPYVSTMRGNTRQRKRLSSVSSKKTTQVNDDTETGNTAFGRKIRRTGLHVYTDERILELTARFKHMTFVREGGFGEIFVGNVGNQMVALKKAKQGVNNEVFVCGLKQLLNEAELLSRYRHRNLVPIVGVCPGPQVPAILYDYMEKGSLYDHIHMLEDIPDYSENIRILLESSEGLAYLHGGDEAGRTAVMHCDVKSANILLDKHLTAKVGDFGLAKKMPAVDSGHSYLRVSEYGGSLGYQAPEILEGEVGPKLDVYSLAVVILEVHTTHKAYECKRECKKLVDMMHQALMSDVQFSESMGKRYENLKILDITQIRELIVDMLKSRHQRITMNMVQKKLRSLYCEMLIKK